MTPPSRRQPPTTPSELPQLDSPSSSQTRETMFGFLTGRNVEGSFEDDRRSQLIAAYGTSSRDPSRPDTAAAAKALGVSQRTVQRWVAGGGITKGHAANLRSTARRAMTTKRGRARALAQTGVGRPPAGKNAIRVGGVQGVRTGNTGNYRPRDIAVQVTEADLEAMQRAWVEHGESGLGDFFHQHFSDHYMGNWHLRSIESIEWDNSTHY